MTAHARPRQRRRLAAAALVAAVSVAGCAENAARPPQPVPAVTDDARGEPAVVTGIVDGDTLYVSRTRTSRGVTPAAAVPGHAAAGDADAAGEERVRILGIDAPELARDGESGECYADQAAAELRRLLPVGTEVTLVADPAQPDRDAYDRPLRHVDVLATGADVGRELLALGSVDETEDRWPTSRASSHTAAAEDARRSGAGLWSVCP